MANVSGVSATQGTPHNSGETNRAHAAFGSARVENLKKSGQVREFGTPSAVASTTRSVQASQLAASFA